MLLGVVTRRVDFSRANCAGAGCGERDQCRRYRVRLDAEWKVGTGQWISADVERAEQGGECAQFRRWIVERRSV